MKIELKTGELEGKKTTLMLEMKISGNPLRPPGQFLRQEWKLLTPSLFRLVAKDHHGFFVAVRGVYAHYLNFYFSSGRNAMADYEKWTKDQANHHSFTLGELNLESYRVGSEGSGLVKNPMNRIYLSRRTVQILDWKITAWG